MKILLVTPNYIPAYRYGGPVFIVHDFCRSLIRKGCEVEVFTTNIDGKKSLDVPLNRLTSVDGINVTYFPVRFLKWWYYSTELSKALKIAVTKFDIVHIHYVFLYPTFIAAYWCRKFKVPYILNPFGALDPDMIKLKGCIKKMFYIKLFEQKNIKNASVIHVHSALEKERFLSMGFRVPIVVIPPGISLLEIEDQTRRKKLEKQYPRLKNKRVILFLSRIHFKKGLDLLGMAFKKVIEKKKDVCLVIAGSGEKDYVRKVKHFYKKLNITKNVIFTNMLLGKDKLSAFYDSDIFILPSYGENFGLAVLEAMACKLPVVITNRVGLYPDIEEYKAGIVTGCDQEEIAQAILDLLDKKDLRKSMGENGRRLVENRFIQDNIVDQMIGIYKGILTGKREVEQKIKNAISKPDKKRK